jgi:hypothetical protein
VIRAAPESETSDEVRDIRRDEELMIARSVCRVFGLPTKTPAS